jgi:hypothetical protein
MLPTPQEQPAPGERAGPDGSRMGGPLVALRLIVGTGPAGVAAGFGSPRDDCLSQARGAREAPVDPGGVAAAFGHRGNPGVFGELIRRGVAVVWCAEGGEEAGRQDGASAWEGVKHGAVGRALGAVCHGFVKGVDGLPGDPELADQGLHPEDRGGDDTLIGRPGGGARDGRATLGHDVGVAPMMGAEEALAGGAARELDGVEGRPWGADGADDGGVVGVDPWEALGEVVLQGTGAAMRATPVVADPTAALVDEWCAGTQRGACRLAGRECVARLAPERKRECRVSGSVLGVAGRDGVAVLGQGPRVAGEQDQHFGLT